MIGPVDQLHPEVDDRESGQRAGIHDRGHPLLDARNVVLRDRPPDDHGFEQEALPGFRRFDDHLDARELAGAAGLFLVGVVDLRQMRDRLPVGHLRRADIGLHPELPLHPVDQDVEMQLPHALHDGLAGFEIGLHPEGRILGGKPLQCLGEFLLVGLGLRLDRDLDHRIREGHRFQHHRIGIGAQGVPRRGSLQPGKRNDVSGERLLDLLPVVRVHHHHAAHPLTLSLGGVEHGVALADRAGIDPDEGERTDERIVHDLERQRRERLRVIGVSGDVAGLLLVARAEPHVGRNVERSRQVIDDGIQHRLNALVLEGGSRKHGNEGHAQRPGPDQPAERVRVRLIALKVALHDLVIQFNRGLDHAGPHLLRLVLQFGAHRLAGPGCPEIVALPGPFLHLDEIDNSLETVLGADGYLDGERHGTCPVPDLPEAGMEIGTDLVHLVDQDNARNPIAVGLAPDRLGLRLHPRICIEHADRPVEDGEGTLNLDREVHMPRCVDDVEAVPVGLRGRAVDGPFPEGGGCSGGDRDSAFLLLLHPVHGGGAVMDLAHLVGLSGVVEDPLGRGGFPGVDVRHDSEVAVSLQWKCTRH